MFRLVAASLLAMVLPLSSHAAPGDAPTPQQLEFFEKKIRPLFVTHCLQCHGADEKKIRGGLRMTTRAELLKGGDTGPSLVPGDAAKSLLITVLSYDGDIRMPPKGKLRDADIADLRTWVEMGAPWPGPATSVERVPGGPLFNDAQKAFWSFQPMKSHPQPAVKQGAWVKSPIDAFLLAKMEEKGLAPAPAADRVTLIRRVTYDLTGLPPTPEEVDAFLADSSPDAFARVVDRLLQSPAYGQRWGRHWLDVARYADSNGLDENTAFANAYRYRDYVIDALNADKPYDVFVREQIAGDLLPPSDDAEVNRQRLTATGFLVLGPKLLAEPDKQKMVMDIVDEQIDVMSKAIMGLTLSCARCHDHKFDPLPTRDYYSIAGMFKSTRTMETLSTVARALERPVATPELEAQRKAHQQRVDEQRAKLNQLKEQYRAALIEQAQRDVAKYLLASAELSDDAANGTPRLLDVPGKRPNLPGLILLEADKFARGDVKVTREDGQERIIYIESAGRSKAFTEYEIEIPTAGRYQIESRYASGEIRPVRMLVDGVLLKAEAAREVTGGFDGSKQKWFIEGAYPLTAGKHVLRLEQTDTALPHIDKIGLFPVAEPKPVAGQRLRQGSVSELAKQHQLSPGMLAQVRAFLLKLPNGDQHPVLGPWLQLAQLADADFAAQATALIAKWPKDGKGIHPEVRALFEGDAPKSLAEVASRYAKLFSESKNENIRKIVGVNGLFQLPNKVEELFSASERDRLANLQRELETIEKSAPAIPQVLAVRDMDKCEDVKVHIRGNHLTLGEDAPRMFLRIIAGEKQTPINANNRSGRLELAQWLTSAEHPLTARVMVNRVWQHHFGEGIVRSPDNFGQLGDRPTHPELLDWLALNFVQNGWSLKKLHRTILLSNAYQMSTVRDPKVGTIDPDNRLLSHFHRRRLEAEAIRDGMLFVAGNLDASFGGTLLNTGNFGYVTNDQSGNGARYGSTRRSIYLPVIRNAVFDFFQAFDFVEPSVMNGKRASTVVAPQALFLLNSPFTIEQSKGLATQLLKLDDERERVRLAYRKAFARLPTATEEHQALEYVRVLNTALEAKMKDPAARSVAAWSSLCQVLLASNEFIYLN